MQHTPKIMLVVCSLSDNVAVRPIYCGILSDPSLIPGCLWSNHEHFGYYIVSNEATLNFLPSGQYSRHFADDIFRSVYFD